MLWENHALHFAALHLRFRVGLVSNSLDFLMTPDFTSVTEVPGVRATRSELSQMYTRYHWAASFVTGKRVLELGCGSGPGLGYFLKKGASRVVGTDIEPKNLEHAREYYKGRSNLDLDVVDAQNIPYPDGSFDVVVLFEAVYYLPSAYRFFEEARRVLSSNGVLLISTVNREWPQFNPSPFSVWYPSAKEIATVLLNTGFEVVVKGGFPDRPAGVVRKLISGIRRAAVRLRLIPDTMKRKEFLKRIFYGELQAIPNEIEDGKYQLEQIQMIDSSVPNTLHVFLYVEATKN